MRHYARRTDANQAEIVAMWRKLGKLWVDTSRQGDGCPDGWLMHFGLWLAIEFKLPAATLRKKQKELHEKVNRAGGKIYIIRDMQSALNLVGRGLDGQAN